MVIRGRTGPSRRRAFHLTEILPRIHLREDRATPEGAHHQQQFEILWRSLTSGKEEIANQGKGGQPVQGGGEEDAEESCTYCGRALDDPAEELEENHVQVPIPCAHDGLVHGRCMLDHAEHLARGHADPRPCVACRSAWLGGNRPPHPAALARGQPMSWQGERWVAVRSAFQFAPLFQRGVPGPWLASYATTGVYSTFELMGGSQLPRSCCAPCFAMRCACLERHTSIFPNQVNGKQLPASTVFCSLRTPYNRRTSCSDFRMEVFTSDFTSSNICRASALNVKSA